MHGPQTPCLLNERKQRDEIKLWRRVFYLDILSLEDVYQKWRKDAIQPAQGYAEHTQRCFDPTHITRVLTSDVTRSIGTLSSIRMKIIFGLVAD